MTASGRFPGTDRTAELGCVPDLAMAVGDHGPEAAQSLGRHAMLSGPCLSAYSAPSCSASVCLAALTWSGERNGRVYAEGTRNPVGGPGARIGQ